MYCSTLASLWRRVCWAGASWWRWARRGWPAAARSWSSGWPTWRPTSAATWSTPAAPPARPRASWCPTTISPLPHSESLPAIIRILKIRICKTGSGSYLHSSRINSNINIFFYFNQMSSDIFMLIFFTEKMEKFIWKFEKDILKKYFCTYIFLKFYIAMVGSGFGE